MALSCGTAATAEDRTYAWYVLSAYDANLDAHTWFQFLMVPCPAHAQHRLFSQATHMRCQKGRGARMLFSKALLESSACENQPEKVEGSAEVSTRLDLAEIWCELQRRGIETEHGTN